VRRCFAEHARRVGERREVDLPGGGALRRAVTDEVLRQGGLVAMLGRSHGAGAPQGATAWEVDLASLADATRVLGEAAAHFGRIDGLVNTAGAFRWQTLEDSTDLAEWTALFQTNLLTCVSTCKAALPHLKRAGGGRIVNVGATGAIKGAAGMGAYAASKAGVMRFTEALADELKTEGITVNAVLPSIIDTPANRADMPKADTSRWVTPAEIAAAVAWLLSDAASAVTGALVPVTGKT
jgi:NAD(P)-dependent dehydrogenase (short-subunit alcohol dehydrogenase family)